MPAASRPLEIEQQGYYGILFLCMFGWFAVGHTSIQCYVYISGMDEGVDEGSTPPQSLVRGRILMIVLLPGYYTQYNRLNTLNCAANG